jgi:hypothetical protein
MVQPHIFTASSPPRLPTTGMNKQLATFFVTINLACLAAPNKQAIRLKSAAWTQSNE